MSRFDDAVRAFDQANAEDPNLEVVNGRGEPRELVHARWLSAWVDRLCPGASEPLRLAARCQHLRRWRIRRDAYEKNRQGYLRWREDLKKFHAGQSEEILRQAGYEPAPIERVRQLNLKKDLATDPEMQVLEDALCLVFLEHQFAGLAAKTERDKMIHILRRTWKKMSPEARRIGGSLPLGERETSLLKEAALGS